MPSPTAYLHKTTTIPPPYHLPLSLHIINKASSPAPNRRKVYKLSISLRICLPIFQAKQYPTRPSHREYKRSFGAPQKNTTTPQSLDTPNTTSIVHLFILIFSQPVVTMKMPNTTYNAVPQPLATNPAALADSLEIRMNNAFKSFNNHCMSCRACRDPYEVHVSGKQLCDVGHRLAQEVMLCLYAKAEATPSGEIRVGFPAGWEALEGMLKAVTKHEMVIKAKWTTELSRRPTAREATTSGQITYVRAGARADRSRPASASEQDLNRRNSESRRIPSYHHESSYPSRGHRGSSIPNPRQSLTEVAASTPRTIPIPSPRLLAASLPTPSPTPSPSASPRVKFNPKVETRLYYP
ncbi:hypothetical protein RUND412_001398 [Rhizina undulata]